MKQNHFFYADDMTATLANISSVEILIKILNDFEERFGLKGRVHGLAHAHESKCCFFACALYSEYASKIISQHC